MLKSLFSVYHNNIILNLLYQSHLIAYQHIAHLKYGKRNSSLGNRRSLGFLGNDESAGQSFVLDHLVAQEFRQSLGSGNGSGFLSSVFLQRSGHGTIFGNQAE